MACDTQFKRTAFHWAAFMGNDIFFEDIIKAHNEKNISSGRAIGKHVIVDNYMTEEEPFIKLFSATDADECTPGFLAVEAGHINVVEVLLRYDYFGSANAQNKRGYRPLHIAAKRGSRDICALLLRKGTDIDAAVNDEDTGLTAVALAAANGHKDIVELLLDHNAHIEDVQAKDGNFERGMLNPRRNIQKVHLPTPLELAAIGGHAEVVKLLASRGAIVRVPSKSKETTLIHLIAKKVTYEYHIHEAGYMDVIAFLIGKGLKVDAIDELGKTALDYALQYGRKSIAEALRVLMGGK